MIINLIERANGTVAPDLTGFTFANITFVQPEIHDFVPYVLPKSDDISLAAAIAGWTYFLAWIAAFYPQMIVNFTRKSVVGLNLDFIALNFTGYLTYSIFNAGLYWIPSLQREYLTQNTGGVIPVQLNDVLFSVHGVLAVIVWIIQASIFERQGQEVSMACITLLLIIATYFVVCVATAIVGGMSWLTFIYYVSYIKLVTSITKYTPQVYLHYKRKTTEGFSIIGVILDMMGGIFSIVQMFLIAYNYDDWSSIAGDPTKLGLGIISIVYCFVIVIQRFIFGNGEYQSI